MCHAGSDGRGVADVHRWAAMKPTLLFCTLVLALTGCSVFGDRVGSGRAVSLQFAKSAGLTVGSPEIQEAVQIADTVLAPQGLTRAVTSLAPDANGMIAYYHYTPERPESCGIFLKNDRLNVVFRERYARGSSKEVKRMSTELADKFRNHYDPKKVRVEG